MGPAWSNPNSAKAWDQYYEDIPKAAEQGAKGVENAILDAFEILPTIEKWLGFPDWLQHPLIAAENEINYLVGEAEYYSALPASLVVGGAVVYYFRKGRRTPFIS
jgi:hypothetical protein